MTIEELIPQLLFPVVGNRCYWDTTPKSGPPRDANGAYLDFVIVQVVGGLDKNYVDQTMSGFSNVRLQVTSHSISSIAVDTLCRNARDAILAGHKPVEVMGSPISVYDPDQELRGRLQYFSIWFKP